LFSSSSQWVPIRFSMRSLTCSPYALAIVVLHLHRWAKGEKLLYFKIEPSSVLGSPHGFIFWSDGPIKLACWNKTKLNLKGTSSQ
jgi:hypothetical protein